MEYTIIGESIENVTFKLKDTIDGEILVEKKLQPKDGRVDV